MCTPKKACRPARGRRFALIEALRRPHIHAVVIPSPEHFSWFGGMYQAMRIETETGAGVLVMTDRPEDVR